MRNLIVIVKTINILLDQYRRDVIHQDAFIILDRPQQDDGSKSANGPLEEELKIILPPEEEEKEEDLLFIFVKESTIKNYLV